MHYRKVVHFYRFSSIALESPPRNRNELNNVHWVCCAIAQTDPIEH